MGKLIVTITPPTPNGDLHIGHLAGPFLAADIFTRVQRQQGHDCVLVSYSDDYQSYMQRKGCETGRDPIEIAAENTDRITETLASAHIDISHWMRAYGNTYYRNAAREVHESAVRAGAIERRRSQEPFCPTCGTWGYEAFGRGKCDYCGSDSDASQCENCAFPPNAARMEAFRCKCCSGAFEWHPVERDFLLIGRYTSYLLREIYGGAPIRHPMQDWGEKALICGPEEWPITRPDEAGLDLAEDGSCRLHTWFLGLAGYMAALREYAETIVGRPNLYDEFWCGNNSTLVHFLGYDCAYSHMVVYPVLLSTLQGATAKPRFYPNQFMKLDGENLSTSRNHAIWVRDLVRGYAPDAVRLYLASIAPEVEETDFQVEAFRKWYQVEYLGTLGALFARAHDERSGVASAGDNGELERLYASIERRWRAAASLDTFSMAALAHLVLDLISIGKQRMENLQPVAAVVDMIRTFGGAVLPDVTARGLVGERHESPLVPVGAPIAVAEEYAAK